LGAFVLIYENSNKENFPVLELLRGFLICYFIHGFYNFGVFHSGNMLYILPIVLVSGFIILEYEIMISRNTLPKEVMDIIGIKWDDYKIVHRFKQYLDWMDVDQEKFTFREVSILQKPTTLVIVSSSLFLILGISTLSYLIISPEMITKTFQGIQFPEYMSIFVFYPFFISIVLGFSGTLNPEYFRNKIIRVPVFISLHIRSKDYEETTVVFYISRKGFYIPILNPSLIGDEVTMEFWIAGRVIQNVKGKVFWRDMGEEGNGGGVLVRFSEIPYKLIFFWKYVLYRQRIKNIVSGNR
jgi:protease PrsW